MSKKRYIDEFKNVHYIGEELGRGGQGVVYKTKDADTVIKFALKDGKSIKDEQEIEQFHKKVKRLIFKPLPQDMNIAKPLTFIKNEAAYVMHLLSEMKPFATLLPQELSKEKAKNVTISNFLQSLYEKDERVAIYFAYYNETGGLRKRLYALSRLAIVLYRLHIRGVVYFDVSHNNIFINDDDVPLIYLIDADNIEYESANRFTLHTPGFEVPEVMKGKPNSTYSDIYAFGILSFLALTTAHPFEGEASGDADWDSDGEEKKEQWELPWVEDTDDESNHSKKGLKGKLTITDALNRLFHILFEEGKNNRYKRPTLPIWIESIEKAANDTIECGGCSMSYYDSNFDICPYCDAPKPRRVVVSSYLYKNDQKSIQRWRFVKEIKESARSVKLPKYLFEPFDIMAVDDTFLELVFSKQGRVELYFESEDKEIYFESTTPMRNLRKRIGIQRLEDGISIRVNDDIDIFVELKVLS